MKKSNISEEMRQFIQLNIPTAGSLETLLFLYKGKCKAWNAETIARELRSNAAMVQGFLEFFETRGLLIKNDSSTYQLNIEQKQLDASLAELEKLYKEKPVSVLNEIYALPTRPGSKIQILADAFKIKKKE